MRGCAVPIELRQHHVNLLVSEPTYRSTGFFAPGPGAAPRSVSGAISIVNGQLVFKTSENQVAMPLGGLTVKFGGHDGRQPFFEHPNTPGWTLSTPDLSIWDHPVLKSDPGLRALLDRSKHSQPAAWRPLALLGGVTLLVTALVVWAVLQKDRWVLAVADRIPVSFEEKLGEQAISGMKAGGKFIQNPSLQQQLDQVTARLLPVVERQELKFRFNIASDTNINAFALPGGYVVVNSGLLAAVKQPEELAGVLAHELAHVTRRHGLRNLIQSAGLMILAQAVFGQWGGLEGVLIQSSQELLSQKYSRDFEREADEVGWNYLLEADIDPVGLISFFQTLKKQQGAMAALENPALALLSTHPATDERIATLEKKRKALPPDRKFRSLTPP